jgi:cytochrome c biogenesis protein CcdA
MTLVIIGFLGGLITGISPCILPILPVVFLTGGAQSASTGANGEPTTAGRSRPYLVIAGLIVSFTAVTLAGSLVLGALGLPQSFLRWAGIVVLAVLGVALIVPRLEHLLERPFQWIPRREVSNERGGFGVGLALGTVFVPCAGPVLAAIIVAGSTGRIDAGTVVLTVSAWCAASEHSGTASAVCGSRRASRCSRSRVGSSSTRPHSCSAWSRTTPPCCSSRWPRTRRCRRR